MELGFFDRFVAKFISRKFLVWILATAFMLLGTFTKYAVLKSEDWVKISLVYIGGQALIDMIGTFKADNSSAIGNFIQNNVLSSTPQVKPEIKPKKTEKEDPKPPTHFGGMQ